LAAQATRHSKAFALTSYLALPEMIRQHGRSLRQTSRYSLPGSKGAPSPRVDSVSRLEMRARGAQAKKLTKFKHVRANALLYMYLWLSLYASHLVVEGLTRYTSQKNAVFGKVTIRVFIDGWLAAQTMRRIYKSLSLYASHLVVEESEVRVQEARGEAVNHPHGHQAMRSIYVSMAVSRCIAPGSGGRRGPSPGSARKVCESQKRADCPALWRRAASSPSWPLAPRRRALARVAAPASAWVPLTYRRIRI